MTAYAYVLTIIRENDDDDWGPHSDDANAIAQLARELQQAIDDTGLPVGTFQIHTRIRLP